MVCTDKEFHGWYREIVLGGCGTTCRYKIGNKVYHSSSVDVNDFIAQALGEDFAMRTSPATIAVAMRFYQSRIKI